MLIERTVAFHQRAWSIEVFGLLGIVAGPTILAAAMAMFRVYMEHRDELEEASV